MHAQPPISTKQMNRRKIGRYLEGEAALTITQLVYNFKRLYSLLSISLVLPNKSNKSVEN